MLKRVDSITTGSHVNLFNFEVIAQVSKRFFMVALCKKAQLKLQTRQGVYVNDDTHRFRSIATYRPLR